MTEKNKNKDNPLKFYAKYSSLAFQMIVIVIAGAFGGKALDGWLKWDFPVFTVVFTILFVIMSIVYGMREIFKNNK
jgi:F0F1-type ATP synthase assembly protein I